MAITTNSDKKEIQQEIIATAEAKVKNEIEVPAGYIKIELSTKGKVGAPAVFHMRNFTTEDLMDLALTDEQEIPIQVVKKMQEIIWEPEEVCDVKKFHEKEVTEALFILYKTFYSSMLPEVDWELTDEDKEYLAEKNGGKESLEYKQKLAAYESGEWKEKWTINLDNIKTYDIPDKFKTVAHIEKKVSKFNYDYSLPKYGDVLILRQFIDTIYKEKDKKFATTKENIIRKHQLDQDFRAGKIGYNGSKIYIPENELKEFNEYEREKTVFATKCLKALHLEKVNGEDVSNLSLQKRLEIIEGPEFDHASFRQASEGLNNLKFGLIEDIDGFDPILRKQVKVHYTFRVPTLLQAIRDNDSDQTVITFE